MAMLVEVNQSDAMDQAADSSAGASLGLKRLDISMASWQKGQRPNGLFGHWKTVVAEPGQAKRLFVDDQVLMNLFDRLSQTDQPQRLAFRFVLALILMRKRLLKYEGSEKQQTEQDLQEWWLMTPKGHTDPIPVLNPQLDEEQVQQVTEQLGEILEAQW